MANVDALTEEWVRKLHLEKRVDLNLQTPSSGESMKVEVGDIPPEQVPGAVQLSSENTGDSVSQLDNKEQHSLSQDGRSHSIPTNDSYLSSIVSQSNTTTTSTTVAHDASGSCQRTPDCACYKCQRQRRRAGVRSRTIPIEPSLSAMNSSSVSLVCQQEQQSQNSQLQYRHQQPQKQKPPPPPPHVFKSQSKELLATEHSTVSSSEQQLVTSQATQDTRAGSFIQRKQPSNISYERQFPRPTYSELDSIYRGQQHHRQEKQQQHHKQQQQQIGRIHESRTGGRQDLQQQYKDSYEISWQDETGDDILPSLRTFQTIFEEKPHGSEGLSDLLESKAEELKTRKMQEKEQLDDMNQQRMEPNRPPKRHDCLTLSYRDGPQHTQLTLYHTMKMNGPKDRMAAYDKALQHCVHANSGLSLWIKNQSCQPSLNIAAPNHRPNFTLKKSTYRSILHLAGRKQKTTPETPDDLKVKNTKLANALSLPSSKNTVTPFDVLTDIPTTMNCASYPATSNKLLLNATPTTRMPCEFVDTPAQSLPQSRSSVDTGRLAALDVEQGRSIKTAKPWSSLGRKSSKTLDSSNIYSVEKVYHSPVPIKESSESFEKSLDDLCKVMTHVDRSVLQTYLEQTNGDYMKTLSVIRDEVTSGNL